jgi:hypothetical protein
LPGGSHKKENAKPKGKREKSVHFKHIKISPVLAEKNCFASFFAQEIISTYVLYLINNEQVMLTGQFSLLVSSFDAWKRVESWLKSGKTKREK